MKRQTIYSVFAITAIGVAPSVVFFRPRPADLAVTPRTGDDTLVVNQAHRAQARVAVLDQYGRPMPADTAVHYQWLSGDAIPVSPDGEVRCEQHQDAVVRASFEGLSREFVLRCRPVAWIEAPTWLDLIVDGSARDLSFIAHGLDGRAVTELRGTVTAADRSVVAVEGTTIRPIRAGATVAIVEVGDAKAMIPLLVYQRVESFVGNPKSLGLMARHVSVARGDTIFAALPKAAFWATYMSDDPGLAPPTIMIQGDGSCSKGNGLQARRIEDGEYAKYCFAGSGARLMIVHGAAAQDTVSGNVAIRLMW